MCGSVSGVEVEEGPWQNEKMVGSGIHIALSLHSLRSSHDPALYQAISSDDLSILHHAASVMNN